MISREKISIFHYKSRRFELYVACTLEYDNSPKADWIKKEAERFGYIHDGPVWEVSNRSYDFQLDVHATYDPSEVAGYLVDYGNRVL